MSVTPHAGVGEPFWSVMIPTYKRTTYLEAALRSVLAQDEGPERMQIEVVDNCSPTPDVQAMVQRVGAGRITFFQQKSNLGMLANWQTCISRARGRWVHILHDDDVVYDGFYARLGEGLRQSPEAVAGLVRYAYMKSDGTPVQKSHLEAPASGLLRDYLPLIAARNRIQMAAIVVRRDVYGTAGPFREDLVYTLDWEMWVRVALAGPIWYEPEVLAGYRTHDGNETSRMTETGADTIDMRRAVEVISGQLPAGIRRSCRRAGLAYVAESALEKAAVTAYRRRYAASRRQLWQAAKARWTALLSGKALKTIARNIVRV